MSCNNNSTRLPISPIVTPTTGPAGPKGDKGDTGPKGDDGESSYTYIAYASDDIGTGFTTTFSASLNYIGIITSIIPLTPVSSDFNGKWFNYKGATGATGAAGSPGVTDVTRILYNNTTGYALTNSVTNTTYTAGSGVVSSNGNVIEITAYVTSTASGTSNRNIYLTVNGTVLDLNPNATNSFYTNSATNNKHLLKVTVTRMSSTTVYYDYELKLIATGGYVTETWSDRFGPTAVSSLDSNLIVTLNTTPDGSSTMGLNNFMIKLFK